VFVDELRQPVPYLRWKRLLADATKAAGVDVTAHGLRHFFASALISGGASVTQVQTVLGHASAVVTLRTYAHLWPGDGDRVRDVADAALAPLARCGPRRRLSSVCAGQSTCGDVQPFLVSQKISAISSILASSSSALPASISPLVPVAPASLVASLNRVCSCGYFSKCGGLK
jgi:integrase-like protein